MTETIISVSNVSFSYGGPLVLDNVSFTVKQNDFISILGPNGGGKSTLLKLILGFIKPQKGEIKLFGKPPKKGRELVGYLPQQTFFNLEFPISVLDVVLMSRLSRKKLFRRFSEEDVEIALNALKTVNMEQHKDKIISELSGGQLQRVFLARALAREPKLLILDEPTSSVDTQTQRAFYELLLKLNKKMAIVLVTHDVGVVSTYVKQIACLNVKLYYHGPIEAGLKKLGEVYNCPIEILAHGPIPHRVLEEHKDGD